MRHENVSEPAKMFGIDVEVTCYKFLTFSADVNYSHTLSLSFKAARSKYQLAISVGTARLMYKLVCIGFTEKQT